MPKKNAESDSKKRSEPDASRRGRSNHLVTGQLPRRGQEFRCVPVFGGGTNSSRKRTPSAFAICHLSFVICHLRQHPAEQLRELGAFALLLMLEIDVGVAGRLR